MRFLIIAALTALSLSACAPQPLADNGLITLPSAHGSKETADRFAQAVTDKGLKLFARIDHSQNATDAGLTLSPTELLIFGNPKAGTPLMNCANSVTIDLPQKALVWQDSTGKVQLSYNDPSYLRARHKITGCEAVLVKIAGILSKLAAEATAP